MAKAKAVVTIDPQATTTENARLIARTRLEELNEWGRYADDPQRVGELHNLRIAAKRLRYTLEIFADVLPATSSTMLEEMTKVQEELGTLHDTDVMIAMVQNCLISRSGQGKESAQHNQQPNKVISRLEKEREEQEKAIVSQRLLDSLITARETLTREERQGLEKLENTLRRRRDEYYIKFQHHWHQLQTQDFSKTLFQALEV